MHSTEQTDYPKPTVFPKCWTSRNNGVNVILKYGKGGGRGGRTSLLQLKFYSNASLFLFISMFLSFSFCVLGCSFSSSSPLKGTTLVWMEYCIVCLCVGGCVFNADFFCDYFSTGRENFLKAIAVGLLYCHMVINFSFF